MGTLMRVVLGLVIVGIVALLLGYWAGSATWPSRDRVDSAPPSATGTSGSDMADRARERGAEIGESVAVAGSRIREAVEETSLTGKIKAKMALDDTVRALAIDVTTEGSTVTLSGRVTTEAERARAIALARETEGVTHVVDRLQVRP